MAGKPDYIIFRDELGITYPTHGYALWDPDPGVGRHPVNVGDVGIIRNGIFHCLFNALYPRDHTCNSDAQGCPNFPEQLRPRMSQHIRKSRDNRQYFHSSNVTFSRESGISARGPGDSELKISCTGKQGALLFLPFSTERKDTGAHGEFGAWMLANYKNCFDVAEYLGAIEGQGRDQPDGKREIILVTGCHLAKSWVNMTFPGQDSAHVMLRIRTSDGGNSQVGIDVNGVDGGNVNFGPLGRDLPENQCVFVRGFRIGSNWSMLEGRAVLGLGWT